MTDETNAAGPPAPPPPAPAGPAAAAAPAALALVLLDIGFPERAGEAGAYLKRLYADPHVLQLALSGVFLDLVAWGISLTRASKLAAALEGAGGAAPEKAALERLSGELAEELAKAEGRPVQPFVAFRHSRPGIAQVLGQARDAGCRRVLCLSARTFASGAGSASLRAELSLCADEHPELDVSMIDAFDADAQVRGAVAAAAGAALQALPAEEREAAWLLFLVQGQPVRTAEESPLPRARAMAEAVRAAMGVENPFSVAFQSGLDPRGALLPQAPQEIERLAREGRRSLVAVPLSHACEGLATRWEIDQVLLPAARAAGFAHLARAAAPAESAGGRAALLSLLRRHLAQMQQLRATA